MACSRMLPVQLQSPRTDRRILKPLTIHEKEPGMKSKPIRKYTQPKYPNAAYPVLAMIADALSPRPKP